MIRRHPRKPKRLPLPKGMPLGPASEAPRAEHWMDRFERERDEQDEALRRRMTEAAEP